MSDDERPVNRGLAGVVIFAALAIAASTWIMIDVTVDRLLRADAERTAVLLASGDGGMPAASAPVMGVRLFDGAGRPVPDEGNPAPFARARPDRLALQALEEGRSVSRYGTSERSGTADTAVNAYVPLDTGGSGPAVLQVTTDQTLNEARFRQIVTNSVAVLLAIGSLGFLMPGAVLMRRNRRRARLARESRDALAAARDEVSRLASTDAMTGLSNRNALAASYEERSRMLRQRDLVLTLLLLDVDHLQAVNDGDGHDHGDRVLTRLADLLREAVAPGDVVGRLGGDEFLMILTLPRYERQGLDVAHRLLTQVATDPAFQRLTVPVSVSIGITQVWKAETSFSSALKEADLALAAAKRDGRNRLARYEPAMGDSHKRRQKLLREITAAIETDNILPVYQPTVSLGDRHIAGFEALARWREADGALLEAVHFPAAFEDARIGTLISERVLDRAVVACGRLRRAGLRFGRLAVNVTECQVADPDFAEAVLDRLMAAGLSPQDLTVELTENILLSHREAAILRTLEQLSHAGVTIAFDDFGTGYASLSHLMRFPIDRIKLDSTFVRHVAAEQQARTICAAVIGMAHELGIKVVAEGVETPAIDAELRKMGCDFGQGFLYARPLTLEGLERVLSDGLAA